MECLEDNIESLSAECKKVISEYAEAADVAPELNDIFQLSCAPFWDKYCPVRWSFARESIDQSISQSITALWFTKFKYTDTIIRWQYNIMGKLKGTTRFANRGPYYHLSLIHHALQTPSVLQNVISHFVFSCMHSCTAIHFWLSSGLFCSLLTYSSLH